MGCVCACVHVRETIGGQISDQCGALEVGVVSTASTWRLWLIRSCSAGDHGAWISQIR
jgi:hypothetical protein